MGQGAGSARYPTYNRWKQSWNGNRFPPPPADSVLYFPGYPYAGSVIKDFSGQGNDGTIYGATWKRLPSGLLVLSYDGSDDITLITHSTSLNFGVGDFSIVCLVRYHSDIGANKRIISKRSKVGSNGWLIYEGGYKTKFGIQSNDGGWANYIGTEIQDISGDVWYMITVVVTGRTSVQFYLNDIADTANLENGNGIANHSSFDNALDIGIGADPDGGDYMSHDQTLTTLFNGLALTSSQVSEIYSNRRCLLGV